MDSGTLFRVRTETMIRVLTEMLEICLHKKKVGGYAYNIADTLLTQIEWFIKRQLYEDSADGMKGLPSDISNTLNKYKSAIHIKNRDVRMASRAPADLTSTDDKNVDP